MEPESNTNSSPVLKVFQEAIDLHKRKNRNYASDTDCFKNFRMSTSFGVPVELGIMTRMSDKWSRICNMLSDVEDCVGENLEDTVIDLGVYAFILAAWLRTQRSENTARHG
jgi:hypothetical protein